MVDDEMARRLKAARSKTYQTPELAAAAMGANINTYRQHEGGIRGFSRHAARYARFFRVDAGWLLTGKGSMDGKKPSNSIEILGIVGAGAEIVPTEEENAVIQLGDIQIPDPDTVGALLIKGNSGYPRYLDGEIIIYYTKQLTPSEVENTSAVVQTWDGRKMVKTIIPGNEPGIYTLDSHNAPPEKNVRIMCGFAIHSIICRHQLATKKSQ